MSVSVLLAVCMWLFVNMAHSSQPPINDPFMQSENDVGGAASRAIPPVIVHAHVNPSNDEGNQNAQSQMVEAIDDLQPGYCVGEDCWHCLRLEALVGVSSLCTGACGACTYCIIENSCAAGLLGGVVTCGSTCGYGTMALGTFYTIKAKCPNGYRFFKNICPTPFYEKR